MLYSALIDTGSAYETFVFRSKGTKFGEIIRDAISNLYEIYDTEASKMSLVHVGKYIRPHST